jgi:hypothetical protein
MMGQPAPDDDADATPADVDGVDERGRGAGFAVILSTEAAAGR